MRIVVAVPEAHVSKPVLDGALEAVTRLNESLIKAGAVPTSDQLIEAGAKWRPEKPGDEHFDHGGLIAKRGHGDCDDWAPLAAATMRASGEDPGARAVVKRSGPKRWHAIVQRSDGSTYDPSLEAGMPGPARAVGVHGSCLPSMRPREVLGPGVHGAYVATPQLALRPVTDRNGQVESWQARADLPWHWQPSDSPSDVAMVTLHRSPVSDQAVVGALRGAWRLGLESGYADPEHLRRVSAIADACEGCDYEELAERYGHEHAHAAGELIEGWFGGKLFKKLGRAAKGVARGALKVAPIATSFIPGGGLASAALKMASPHLKKALAKKRHLPPVQRARALAVAPRPGMSRGVSPLRRPAPAAAAHPGGPQWLPYPYPMPYPIPGWAGPGGAAPGTAWPPR